MYDQKMREAYFRVAAEGPPTKFTLSKPSKLHAKLPAAIGFPAGPKWTCPGATSICSKACYARKGRFIFDECQEAYLRNWQRLLHFAITKNVEGAARDLSRLLKPSLPFFRFLESGDLPAGSLGEFTAQVFARVCELNPTKKFWLYTRSWETSIKALESAKPPNLVVWYSVDSENATTGLTGALNGNKAYGPWPHDKPFPERVVVCPATVKEEGNYFRKTASGKLELIPGACHRCGYCWKGKAKYPVAFLKH